MLAVKSDLEYNALGFTHNIPHSPQLVQEDLLRSVIRNDIGEKWTVTKTC